MAKLRLIYNQAPVANSNDGFMPYNDNGTFGDSWLGYDPNNDILYSLDSFTYLGLRLDFPSEEYSIGTSTNNITCDENAGTINFNGAGITSGTHGGNTNQHLNIVVNGSNYKINLRLP